MPEPLPPGYSVVESSRLTFYFYAWHSESRWRGLYCDTESNAIAGAWRHFSFHATVDALRNHPIAVEKLWCECVFVKYFRSIFKRAGFVRHANAARFTERVRIHALAGLAKLKQPDRSHAEIITSQEFALLGFEMVTLMLNEFKSLRRRLNLDYYARLAAGEWEDPS